MSTDSIIMAFGMGALAFIAASDSESGPVKRTFAIAYLVVRGCFLLSVGGGYQAPTVGALLIVGAIVGWYRGR